MAKQVTATSEYHKNRASITRKLEQVREALEALDDRQTERPNDWGFAGTAAHIKTQLDEILRATK